MTLVACVDVGGTSVKVGVLDTAGRLVDRRTVPVVSSRSPDGHEVLGQVADLVGDIRTRHEVVAAGLVVPGIVDGDRGVAEYAANLGWRDAAFRDVLADRIGLPVALGHDVRAGAVAESALGASRGYRNSVFLPIGTGIASAAVVDGRVLSAGGWAGEIGHVDVGHGEPCSCGLTGCLEVVASASAIRRRYADRTAEGTPDTETILDRATAGDPAAVAVCQDAVGALGLALSWLAGVLAPEVVVVGGGLSRAGDRLLVPLRDDLRVRLSFQRVPDLVVSGLGDQAGCIGAGLLALDLPGVSPRPPGPAAPRPAEPRS